MFIATLRVEIVLDVIWSRLLMFGLLAEGEIAADMRALERLGMRRSEAESQAGQQAN